MNELGMNLEKVFIEDGKFLVIRFDDGFEYDPKLDQVEQYYWLDHMREKLWFTKNVEDEVMKVLNKQPSYWIKSRRPQRDDL